MPLCGEIELISCDQPMVSPPVCFSQWLGRDIENNLSQEGIQVGPPLCILNKNIQNCSPPKHTLKTRHMNPKVMVLTSQHVYCSKHELSGESDVQCEACAMTVFYGCLSGIVQSKMEERGVTQCRDHCIEEIV